MIVSMTMIGTEAWFRGDIRGVLELIEIADRKGIDLISLPDHVVMSDDLSGYPYVPRSFAPDADFYEPLVLHAAIAARTRRIRLETGVLLLPLRPAVLIAKQIATLDVLSGGRVELGVGVGWQKAEYDFEGVQWEGRFGRMMETIEACRLLWTQCPASYEGRFVRFTRAYSKPFPLQGGNLPVLLGIGPSETNIERLAKAADGWAPVSLTLDKVGHTMQRIRARLVELGRNPDAFRLRLLLPRIEIDDRADLDASLAHLPDLAALGCTEVNINPAHYCTQPEQYEGFLDKVIAARDGMATSRR